MHTATAAELFHDGVSDAVTSEDRRRAKAINFGLIYGMSTYGLSQALAVPVSDAKLYVDRYFQRYPNVLGYMEGTKAQAAADGFVTTLFGRRIFVPGIADPNGTRRAAAQRAAINAPVQGAAADVIKKAMVAVDRWLRTSSASSSSSCPPAHLVMQVRGDV